MGSGIRRWVTVSKLVGLLALILAARCEVDAQTARESGAAPTVKDLITRLADPNPMKALDAAQRLKAKAPTDPEAVQGLATAIKSPHEMVRLTVIEALPEDLGERTGEVVNALDVALGDKDPAVREAAALGLFRLGKPASTALPELLNLLGDRAKQVRDAGILALVRLEGGAIPGLVQSLASRDDSVRFAASEALGRMGAGAVPALMKTLQSSDVNAAEAAGVALTHIGEPAAASLAPLVRTADAATLRRVEQVLSAIGAPAVPVLVAELRGTKK